MNSTSALLSKVRPIADLFVGTKHSVRVVGGAVRDLVMGVEPKDHDLATPALPQEVVALAKAAGLSVIETGLQHGTVTVVADGVPFEITTLRIDKDHDGRWATVEFTDDWKLDAARRDFTMNAMSLDMNGEIHDYFGGRKDIAMRVVRFVGDPIARIKEDYLRILRYFRFLGRMGGPIDDETAAAIEQNSHGLTTISGERIWMEMSKIFSGPDAPRVIDDMLHMFPALFAHCGVNSTTTRSDVARYTKNPVTVLASLIAGKTPAEVVNARWKLSADEFKLLQWLTATFRHSVPAPHLSEMKAHATGKPGKAWAWELAAMYNALRLMVEIDEWDVPVFPVKGQDLLDLGMKPGKVVGDTLAMMKQAWTDSDYSLNKASLLAMLPGGDHG